MTRYQDSRPAATKRTGTAIGLAALIATLLTCAFPGPAHAATRTSLTGLFRLQAGTWSGGAHGSYFRMLQPDGKTYLTNTSSKATDKTYTLLSPGMDGGLRTGVYQSTPTPAFAANGDALAGKVTAPTPFFGVKFATATNKMDPQTKHSAAVPAIYATGTKLSGNLSAFAASWNNQHFNQGAPKPNGTSPGFTRAVSGTYSASTHKYTLTWRSLIVGGPFNKFTGEWHLAGVFVPAKAAKRAAVPATHSATPTPTHSATPSAGPSSSAAIQKASPSPTRQRRTPLTARPTVSAPARPTRSAVTATSAPARIAAHTVADSTDAGNGDHATPWLIGGGIAVLAVAGLAVWLVRLRTSR